MLVYDVNSTKSFETLDSWRDEFLIQVRAVIKSGTSFWATDG